MAVTVGNITAHSATVIWQSSPAYQDSFYNVMHHPNWDNLLMSFTRKNFLKEYMVPARQNMTTLANLTPGTTYVLCVTCHSASDPKDQCQTFSTLEEGDTNLGSDRKELEMGVWLASSILLSLLIGVLFCSCLYPWCPPTIGSSDHSVSGLTLLQIQDNTDKDTSGQVEIISPFRSRTDSQPVPIIDDHVETTKIIQPDQQVSEFVPIA